MIVGRMMKDAVLEMIDGLIDDRWSYSHGLIVIFFFEIQLRPSVMNLT